MKIISNRQITDAAMELIIEKGYSNMTTKDIAVRANVNETTLFRRFGSKKEIILRALSEGFWLPVLNTKIFEDADWDLRSDLERFMLEYIKKITPDMVKMSIGLRSPQIYEDTAPYIMKVPESFINALQSYFEIMKQKGKIIEGEPKVLAQTIFSSIFGFVFLQASFGNMLSLSKQEKYVKESIKIFVNGIE